MSKKTNHRRKRLRPENERPDVVRRFDAEEVIVHDPHAHEEEDDVLVYDPILNALRYVPSPEDLAARERHTKHKRSR